ncbi:MAG: thiol:disulfide interchange protein [Cellvibrionales bacterium]|jgi:thiol:disulfide interchange protein/DsbC/DsbD-like thiol-disulfide interchange protein|nr:thiol:disulfide interchange protein [Cellvibrionales bacterium]
MLQTLLTSKALLSPRHALISLSVTLCMMLSLLASTAVVANTPVFGEQKAAAHIKVGLVSEQGYLVAGETAQLALRLLPDEGWHTYWKNPGDTGLPTRVIWQLPEQFRAGDLEWPVPERIDYQGAVNFGYHGETWLPVSISVPVSIASGAINSQGEITLSATAKWLICKDVCIPGKAELQLVLPLRDRAQANIQEPVSHPLFDEARSKIPRLIYTSNAAYAVDEQIDIAVALNALPAFDRLPQVFIGNAGIVDNFDQPSIKIAADQLHISAKKDYYLEEAPELLSVLLVTPAEGGQPQAIEFTARKKAALAIVDNSLVNEVASSNTASAETSAPISIFYALLLAVVGGLILNAMPCVFPVLSLKIVSLVESGNHNSIERRRHGIAYTAGVILSFLLIAGLLIALRFAGEQIGWGFQLQSPWFIAFLVYLLFVLGLSLSGFIELGSSLQNLGAGLGNKERSSSDWRGSFFTGVLATVVATPCTAPFMGTAMGFALGQSAVVALLIFAAMGLGLALPFLLIAFIPFLANALPKPGNWMVRLKEFLAFPIYLTVIWLLWVFSRQTGGDAVALMLVGLVLVALALWIWRQTQFRDDAFMSRAVAAFILVAAIGLALYAASVERNDVVLTDIATVESDAQEYTPERLQQALDNGEAVFVNMTADWCITCKVNERIALGTNKVKSAFAAQSITYLKGDWTNSDPVITEYLATFSRNGVPLYVYYEPGKTAIVLPQILTPSIVIDAIR